MAFLRVIPCPAVSSRRSFSAMMGALAKGDAQYAARTAEQAISGHDALELGLKEKAKEFAGKGSELYAKA